MQLMYISRAELERGRQRNPFYLVSFRDPFTAPVDVPDSCIRRLDIECYDTAETGFDVAGPTEADAKRIADFVKTLPKDADLVIQCEAGVGRSAAVAMAVMRLGGDTRYWKQVRAGHPYNRRLYRTLCGEFGLDVPREPLVALAVRVKYPIDRMRLFLHSVDRQRYDNITVVAVSDGPNADLCEDISPRLTVVQTPRRRGLWGHPYRHVGITKCLELGAEFIGLQNDDNYLTPGYVDQLVNAAQEGEAELVLCQMLHSYSGWGVVSSEPRCGTADIGNWLAAAELMRRVPWSGTDFFSDGKFVERLASNATKVVQVKRPLFVKN